MIQPKHRQKGLSLVELMVAIVIGLLLVAGVTQLFVNNRVVYSAQDNQARIHENARYTLQLLTEAIQRAGYLGCATRNASDIINTLSDSPGFIDNFAIPLQGNASEGRSWNPPPDSSLRPPMTSGNDIITVRTGIGSSMRVLAHDNITQQLELGNNHGLSSGDVVMVSDCINAFILRIEDVAGNIASYDTNFDVQFDVLSAQITPIVTRTFFIRTPEGQLPALYERVNDQFPRELVQGIENLQIQFGEDTNQDGAVNHYVRADAVGNWRNIVSVRVRLDAIATGDTPASSARGTTLDRPSTTYQKTIALRSLLP